MTTLRLSDTAGYHSERTTLDARFVGPAMTVVDPQQTLMTGRPPWPG